MRLAEIQSPADLKRCSLDELAALAVEIRARLIAVTASTGGHVGAGLGVVELTLALHKLLSCPLDTLIWDVSHQCYPHKLLTGRQDRFDSIRRRHGLSGFCRREESEYDAFTAGHGGPGLSQAVGMAYAHRLAGERRRVAVVIGDGSLGEGVALEALNHLDRLPGDLPLTVIYNDNSLAISPTVGSLQARLREMCARWPRKRRRGAHSARQGRLAGLRRRLQTLCFGPWPAVLVETLGLCYLGPVDGHHLPTLLSTLEDALSSPRPTFVHVITQKGRGFPGLSARSDGAHAVSSSHAEPHEYEAQGSQGFTKAFTASVERRLQADANLVCLTAAMLDGSGLAPLKARFPDRVLDVGMAEQHALAMASGLARAGRRVLVAMYSTFLQRGYDQLIHDLALQHLPVTIALDRAGLVGQDGATHQGLYDLAFLRVIPDLALLAPADATELDLMLSWALRHPGLAVLRYPRAATVIEQREVDHAPVVLGRGELPRQGADGAVIALGTMLYPALEAVDKLRLAGISLAVASPRFVKPLDADLLADVVARAPWTVVIEDHLPAGGFTSALLEVLCERGIDTSGLHAWALPDAFHEHGDRAGFFKDWELDPDGLARRLRALAEPDAARLVHPWRGDTRRTRPGAS